MEVIADRLRAMIRRRSRASSTVFVVLDAARILRRCQFCVSRRTDAKGSGRSKLLAARLGKCSTRASNTTRGARVLPGCCGGVKPIDTQAVYVVIAGHAGAIPGHSGRRAANRRRHYRVALPAFHPVVRSDRDADLLQV